MNDARRDFSGAKIILHRNGALLSYLRDDKPTIPFPALWDLPGGGAEGDETPEACALRETFEEFGLRLPQDRITWGRKYPSVLQEGQFNWFYAAPITQHEIDAIRFGEEGQFWRMMPLLEYIAHPKGIPHLQAQVRDFWSR